MVKETIRACLPCQVAGNHPPPEPLKMTHLMIHCKIRPILASSKRRGRTFYAHATKVYSGCNCGKEELETSDEPLSPKLQRTPHSTTNTSPSESLNNRKIKATLPEMILPQNLNRNQWLNMMLGNE